ncbi:MAG: hypothetical protein ACI93R_001372 [Flavobacteriales bacterium]|jgi:hypothetical protein
MNRLFPLLADTWRFFTSNYYSLFKLILPITIPLSLWSAIASQFPVDEGKIHWLALGPSLLLHPIIQGVIIIHIAAVINGEPLSRRACYKLSQKFWLPLILLYIMTSIVISAGFILFILPGLFVLARLMFSEYYCIIYKQKPIDAFISSWEQTRDHQWLLLLGVINIVLLTTVPILLIKEGIRNADAWNPLLTFTFNIFEYFVACLLPIFGYRVFTSHIENTTT